MGRRGGGEGLVGIKEMKFKAHHISHVWSQQGGLLFVFHST